MTGDFDQVTSVWPVLAIGAFVGIPAFFSWLNSKKANEHSKRGADEIIHQSTNNSGSTMKDSLDRIEGTLGHVVNTQTDQGGILEDLATRVVSLERAAEKRQPKRMWWGHPA